MTWLAWPRGRTLNRYQIVPPPGALAVAVQVTRVPTLAGAGRDGVSVTVMAEAIPDPAIVIKVAIRHTHISLTNDPLLERPMMDSLNDFRKPPNRGRVRPGASAFDGTDVLAVR